MPVFLFDYLCHCIMRDSVIIIAYGVKYWQIQGGPSWVEKDYFDVDAKAERPSTNEEFHVMLRNLLEERFRLKGRRQSREEPVFEMHVDKAGVKMREHNPPENAPPVVKQTSRDGKLGIEGSNVSTDDLATYFSSILRQMVINKTGLPGRYDLVLLNSAANLPEPVDPAAGTLEDQILFEDIPSQLGLRMVSSKGPVERVVIEHAEKPSEN
jgi:uncharacterized protein (TIGR03435 family)